MNAWSLIYTDKISKLIIIENVCVWVSGDMYMVSVTTSMQSQICSSKLDYMYVRTPNKDQLTREALLCKLVLERCSKTVPSLKNYAR